MEAWGRTLTRSSLLFLAALGLAGCMSSTGITASALQSCKEVSQKALRFVNWAQVPEVDVKIRHDEFTPMIIRMRQGWPYVMRFRNRDDKAQVFNAHEFFSNVSVVSVSIGGRKAEDTCFYALWIPPHETVELKLVASTDGRYEFENAAPIIPGLFSLGPSGVIIVDERRPRI